MLRNSVDAFAALLRKYRGRIFYYGGVALVLAAIAFAADSYHRSEPEALVAPPAEVSTVFEMMQEPERIRPDGMELMRAFSTQPQWNGELRQWENHEATDYILADGAVLCLQGGTVQTVGESGVYGGFVELLCGDLFYRYASILPDAEIQVGDEIKAGARIGVADDSMPGECFSGAHLHLEVFQGGKPTDFESLFAKNDA